MVANGSRPQITIRRVLALAMQMVAHGEADLLAACKPLTTVVPMISSYYIPTSKIMTTVCSGTISLTDMLGYAALAAGYLDSSASRRRLSEPYRSPPRPSFDPLHHLALLSL
jgi:hypothetical protein